MHPLLRKLAGGDLRSIGKSDEVVRLTLQDALLVEVLVDGMQASDPVIRMRCADAFEKVTAAVPGAAQPFASQVLELLSHGQPQEILWHLLQVVPRIVWSADQLPVVLAAVAAAHNERSSVVRADALQAEVELLAQVPERKDHVVRLVRMALSVSAPAVRSRACRLMVLLEKAQRVQPIMRES